MRKIYLVRHGQTDANVDKRYCGVTDVPLNNIGVSQAIDIKVIIEKEEIDKIYSSPLARARKTAEIISDDMGIDVEYKNELMEMSFGDLENLTFSEISEKYPETKEKMISEKMGFKFPNGDSLEDVYLRCNKIFYEILNDNKEENILIVAHGGVISSILTEILSGDIKNYWNIEVENAKIATIIDNDGFLYLKSLNRSN